MNKAILFLLVVVGAVVAYLLATQKAKANQTPPTSAGFNHVPDSNYLPADVRTQMQMNELFAKQGISVVGQAVDWLSSKVSPNSTQTVAEKMAADEMNDLIYF